MIFQNIEWLMCPPPLLRTAVRMFSGTMAQLLASSSSMRLAGQVGRGFQRLIEVGDVGVVVLAVMDLHRLLVDVRLQGVGRVRQRWKCEWHIVSPVLSPLRYFKASARRNMVVSSKCRVKICIPTGSPVGRLTARHAHARDSRQASGDGVDIGKVHRDGIVYLLSERECGERRHGRDYRVHFLEGVREIARHQRRAPSAPSNNTRRNTRGSARTCPA